MFSNGKIYGKKKKVKLPMQNIARQSIFSHLDANKNVPEDPNHVQTVYMEGKNHCRSSGMRRSNSTGCLKWVPLTKGRPKL